MSSSTIREREQDLEDAERYSKRLKTKENEAPVPAPAPLVLSEPATTAQEQMLDISFENDPHILPPSHALLGIPLPIKSEEGALNFLETDVGISEYVGRGEAKVEGIIKQRFTDFLVYEVDQDGNVIHLKSLEKPKSSKEEPEPIPTPEAAPAAPPPVEQRETALTPAGAPTNTKPVENEPWPASFDEQLKPFLSDESTEKLKIMFLEGPEPPLVSDSGWAGRGTKVSNEDGEATSTPEPIPSSSSRGRRGRGDRGRGGRGGGRGGGRPGAQEDHRRVISEPMDSKENRTAFHKIVRELFKGKLDTETDTSASADNGQRIVIKWGRGGRRGGGQRGGVTGSSRPSRGNFPPYIHFTLQKTNRDTQDALGHLARNLHVNIKDLGVAGTKDKRGVTVQRVSVKRNSKHVEDIWRFANGIGPSRKPETALSQRGDRGIRIGDLVYRKAGLELGMLKGNAFVITLRNAKVESQDILDEAMNTIKAKGFINYYGMQRFGTASVPTHAIGLALLKSDWNKAISLILQKRHGEHPDVAAARDAWLVDRDIDKALSLLPRRVVAERCILESFKKMKGDTRNAMGALSTIPRNLRLMYIHAYQSYVWNAIVSERIKMHGPEKPVVGDLVFEKLVEDDKMDADEKLDEDEEEQSGGRRRNRKPYVAPKVKTLTEEDLPNYTIFDVIMPLPGTDVAYPGGKLGERYREFLSTDGLDPNNFVRRQREYTLNGSYRAIIHLPKELSWAVMRYTDPDVALAQSDEDRLLGFDAPCASEDGRFMALQIKLQLGTAAYATMALREITKMDTSSHIQTNLTTASEDQKYRGTEAEAELEDALEMPEEAENALLEAVE